MSEHKHSLHLKQQTEMALKKINEHEKVKQLQMMTLLNLSTENSSPAFTGVAFKNFEPRQKVKVQLLPHSLAYYKMQLNPLVDSKIIIRHFRGDPIDMYICFDRLTKQLQKAPFHFSIKDEMIIKLPPKQIQNSKSLILIFKNIYNLSIFVFRVDLKKVEKVKRQIRTDKSIGSIEFSETEGNQQKLKRSKSSKGKHKKHIQVSSQQILCARPQQKLKRILQLRQVFEQKKQAAVKRMENIEIYKQKQAEALKVVSSCKKLFTTYQELVIQQQYKKQQIFKASLPVVYAIKYCLLTSMISNERESNMKRVLTIRSYEKKFIKKIRRAYRESRTQQPLQQIRQLEPFAQFSCLIANSLNRVSIKKSTKVIFDAFQNCFPGLLVNISMNISSNYRRVVRGVQRRWKSRFDARMKMLQMYSEEQLQVILAAYPQLRYVQKQYRENNRSHYICIQYQKQTTSKMKDLISAYEHKLQQIQQYKQINQEIKLHNQGALKKKQKDLLQIPKKPAFPQFRFFRDLLFMKSMIRGELQVYFRKFKKRNPKIFQQPDTNLSPKKVKIKGNRQ